MGLAKLGIRSQWVRCVMHRIILVNFLPIQVHPVQACACIWMCASMRACMCNLFLKAQKVNLFCCKINIIIYLQIYVKIKNKLFFPNESIPRLICILVGIETLCTLYTCVMLEKDLPKFANTWLCADVAQRTW